MRTAIKLLYGAALALFLTIVHQAPISWGEAWAQAKQGPGCGCMSFCKSGQGNKCS